MILGDTWLPIRLYLGRLYFVWVLFAVVLFFFLFIIPLYISIPFRRQHVLALWLHYLWAWGIFRLSFLSVRVERRFPLDRKQQYILCANHFSYLDIPALSLFPRPFKFVGKSQLRRIPLFGFMYRHIHIPVDRASYKSRAQTLEHVRWAIRHGYTLGFFPEGGIRFTRFPIMRPFQDGAFRVAAEHNIPIVPVTFPDNHHILPSDGRFKITRKPCRIIHHAPIKPTGRAEDDIKQLKKKVYRVIQDELNAHNSPSAGPININKEGSP